MKPTAHRLRRSVLPVRARYGTVLGTATAIDEGLALTARSVVTAADPDELTLGDRPGVPVLAVETVDASELALLVVPGLDCPALRPRTEPVWVGEHVLLPGYPGGYWAKGPVASAAVGHFTLRPPPRPGTAGAPAVDLAGRLIGVVTPAAPGALGAGLATRCAGPPQLTTFLDQLLTVSL